MSEIQTPSVRSNDAQAQRAVLPAVDVFEDASGITLLADMPGVPKDRLDVKVEADTLSIERWVSGSRSWCHSCIGCVARVTAR